jgi:iron complex transport system ATP-binding protein
VRGLTLWRGDTTILKDVAWRVERGEHWVILGANGSGKTSLLSALTGYVTPSGGEMRVLGRVYGWDDWRKLRLKIGMVSTSILRMMPEDEPALDTVISGRYAMVDFWGRATKSDRATARRILRQVECSHLEKRPWIFLSQGERQRVLIGRALMARPRLLILDEPCAGLDPVARDHFLQFLQRLGKRRTGPAIILVTHHVEEIMPVFTHVLVLNGGHVAAAGSRRDVLTSRALGKAFGCRVRIDSVRGRYRLAVRPGRSAVL